MSSDAQSTGAAIILAAGFSRRFGRDKRREQFKSDSLLEHTCGIYLEAFDRVVVVLRPGESSLVRPLRSKVEVIENISASKGMSTSIAAGVEAIGNAPWAVIALADMPFVQQGTLRTLRIEMESTHSKIIRLRYRGRYGNPVGFPSACFELLRSIEGDQGAKSVIESQQLAVSTIDVEDEGILIDLDTPDEMKHQTKHRQTDR